MKNKISFPIIASFVMLFVYLFLIYLGIKFVGNFISGTKTVSPTPTPTILPTQPPIPSPTSQTTLGEAATKEECESVAGRWGRWGLLPEEYCQIPAKDAGKPCTDGSQCQYDLCMSREQNAQGVCATYRQEFGCYSIIRNGKVDSALCVD